MKKIDKQKKILLLCAGAAHIEIIKQLQDKGFYVIATDDNAEAAGKCYANEFYQTNIFNKEMVFALAKEKRVDAILPVNDVGVRSAAFASKKLSLIGLPEDAAELSNNKFLMREKWQQHGLAQPHFIKIKDFFSCRDAVKELSYPLIMKPTDCGGGSRGVIKVNSEDELEEAFQFTKKYTFFSDDIIIEKFITGTELTVEGIAGSNTCQILAVSDKEHFKHENYCVASSLNYYANISEEVNNKVLALANKAVNALNIKNSAFHIEMIVCNDEPYLVEISARAGGGFIFPIITGWVSGVDFVGQYVNLLLGENLDIIPKYRKGAVYGFFSSGTGRITNISGLDEAANLKGAVDIKLFKKLGEYVKTTTMDNERIGYMIVLHENRDKAVATAEEIKRIVKIETSNFS